MRFIILILSAVVLISCSSTRSNDNCRASSEPVVKVPAERKLYTTEKDRMILDVADRPSGDMQYTKISKLQEQSLYESISIDYYVETAAPWKLTFQLKNGQRIAIRKRADVVFNVIIDDPKRNYRILNQALCAQIFEHAEDISQYAVSHAIIDATVDIAADAMKYLALIKIEDLIIAEDD